MDENIPIDVLAEEVGQQADAVAEEVADDAILAEDALEAVAEAEVEALEEEVAE